MGLVSVENAIVQETTVSIEFVEMRYVRQLTIAVLDVDSAGLQKP